ncbi:GMC family oxidoreductase [Mycolicibacterium palauense]|uniref:GMC family oxidoreductase n=1 Tax=Mycolicibacterium palauense TaxID=2034511 RepID=UPI000BFEC302|nr:GMC family oxidoreductase N-terminal domain-containing protein [Mycolicibacterium palauense]
MDQIADYVIVGTGSAGAVLAHRLSADPAVSVVALEAGPADADRFVRIPAAFAKLFRSPLDWDYLTEAQPQVGDRRFYWPRGKMLGGSSSMNAMMWVRGFAADYDEWAAHAGDAWSFAAVAKLFDRIEGGALHIEAQRSPRRSTTQWLTAVQQAGYPVELPNRDTPGGFAQTAVCQRRGARWSSADGYLRPALQRDNLTVLTGAAATRVLVDDGRAVGVEIDQRGRRRVVRARREVILSAGAVNTPKLLLLSGIGDRDHLDDHGVPVVRHTPEVGRNLQDHLVVPLGFEVAGDSLFDAERPRQLAAYLLRRRGMLTSNIGEAYGFIRSRPDLELPDLELIFAPAPFFDEGLGTPTAHAVVFGPILVKPHSRGRVGLRSADPLAKPVIDPRYLSDPEGRDRAAMMAGLQACARIAETAAMKRLITGIARPRDTDTLDDAALQRALQECSHTLYHPVGTCRMGTDEHSVVDPELRVRGIEGLRVADASVMPTIIRGHTHAPSVVIGERAAELIRS